MINFRPNENLAAHKSVFQHSAYDSVTHDAIPKAGMMQQKVSGPTPDQLIGLSKRLYSMRLRRQDFFSSDLFGEPGWDMLLALFNAEAGGHKLTVSSLCASSQSPSTTSLRWLDRLIQLDLVARTKSPLDGRVFFIVLRPSARTAISNYLREIWESLFAAN